MKPSSKTSGGQVFHSLDNDFLSVSLLTTRYIGHLANASFRLDLRENVAEVDEEGRKDISERALNYFKQVFAVSETLITFFSVESV